jgi:predicted GIY-YIG superfamily endonuclease
VSETQTYSVYRLVFPDGSYYVGVSSDPSKRFESHLYYLRRSSHGNAKVQAAYELHGDPTLLVCARGMSREDALWFERETTRDFNTNPLCLNRTCGGGGLSPGLAVKPRGFQQAGGECPHCEPPHWYVDARSGRVLPGWRRPTFKNLPALAHHLKARHPEAYAAWKRERDGIRS